MINNNIKNDETISKMLNFMGSDLSSLKGNLILDDKYKKNKSQLIDILEACSYKPSNDKEFFKLVFKLMDSYLNEAEDIVFSRIDIYTKIDFLSKVILFLKYKKDLNYKEKIKMIKSLCEGVTLEDLLICEKYVLNTIEYFAIHDIPLQKNMFLCSDIIENIKDETDRNIFRAQLSLFKNAIEIIKCVLFNGHKKELMFVENGVPKYKIVPIKTIYNFDFEFKISPEINVNELMKLLKIYEKDKKQLIYDINSETAGILLNAYLKDDLRIDAYNKCLLDKSYNTVISNRLDSFLNTNSYKINSYLFMTRKILIPKNGVILLIENEESPIESILLSEKSMGSINNIYFVTRYKDGTEVINSVMLNKNMLYNATIFGGFAEFEDNFFNTLAYVLKFLEVNSVKDDNYHSLKFSVISPSYWKYRDKNYKSENDVVNNKGVVVKREFEIEIAPFVRKIKGEPSLNALKLADKLGIILEEHHTIVKPHKRTYNKVKWLK